MGSKRKNLSKEDHQDVSIYESQMMGQKSNLSSLRISELNSQSIKVKCLNEKQKMLKKAIEQKDIVIATGPAGTGKTYLSLLMALHLMKKYTSYKKLVLVKSVQTIAGESIGYLPGTLWEKMEPYMYSFTGNLDKILKSKKTTQKLIEEETIEIMPIAYVRGVTIDNSIVIIDEAQNIDMHTFKTIITRIGKNSKMIFLGDIEQIDRKNTKESCLTSARDLFKDQEHADSVHFTSEESVRNPIIPEILNILDENQEKKAS